MQVQHCQRAGNGMENLHLCKVIRNAQSRPMVCPAQKPYWGCMSPSYLGALFGVFPLLVPWPHNFSLYVIFYHPETFHFSLGEGCRGGVPLNAPFSQSTASRIFLGLVFAWPYDNISDDNESWRQYLGSACEPGQFALHLPRSPPVARAIAEEVLERISLPTPAVISIYRLDSHHPGPLWTFWSTCLCR